MDDEAPRLAPGEQLARAVSRGDGSDRLADERDAAASIRDEAAEAREIAVVDETQLAAEEDRVLEARDRAAAVLDREEAALRDAAALVRDLAAEARDAAGVGDARQTAKDRVLAGADRAAALLDRQEAVLRAAAALVRDVAAEARETADAGEAQLAAEEDRVLAAEDRAAAALDRREAALHRRLAADDLQHAYRDDLTGALLRDPGSDQLRQAVDWARRRREPFAIAYLDVDHLKAVNDAQGHASGDRLLHEVGSALREGLRSYDVIVRYGGDEFVCALRGSPLAETERRLGEVGERLSRAFAGASLSVGCAELREDETLEELIDRADREMYDHRRTRSAGPARGGRQAEDRAAGSVSGRR